MRILKRVLTVVLVLAAIAFLAWAFAAGNVHARYTWDVGSCWDQGGSWAKGWCYTS